MSLSKRKPTTASKKPAKAAAKAKPSASKPRAGKPTSSKQSASTGAREASASRLIAHGIRELGDWRGETLARMRALILEAEPAAIEEWKWRGVPVWSRDGIV